MFDLPKYNYFANRTFKVYSFLSSGPRGSIQKIAKFSKLTPHVYNFGFGDYDPLTGDIWDTRASNNQDTDIIMGTLGSIIYDFTTIFPDAVIIIEGTSAARVRLYQMNLNKYLTRIEPIFEIYALKNNCWEPFRKGKNYDAFMGRRRL